LLEELLNVCFIVRLLKHPALEIIKQGVDYILVLKDNIGHVFEIHSFGGEISSEIF